jgi:IS30 family transposase
MRLDGTLYYTCHETIYRYIYGCKRGVQWYPYLSKAKPYRGKRLGRRVKNSKYTGIKLINTRPEEIYTREQFDHWEGDNIAFSKDKYLNSGVVTIAQKCLD